MSDPRAGKLGSPQKAKIMTAEPILPLLTTTNAEAFASSVMLGVMNPSGVTPGSVRCPETRRSAYLRAVYGPSASGACGGVPAVGDPLKSRFRAALRTKAITYAHGHRSRHDHATRARLVDPRSQAHLSPDASPQRERLLTCLAAFSVLGADLAHGCWSGDPAADSTTDGPRRAVANFFHDPTQRNGAVADGSGRPPCTAFHRRRNSVRQIRPTQRPSRPPERRAY